MTLKKRPATRRALLGKPIGRTFRISPETYGALELPMADVKKIRSSKLIRRVYLLMDFKLRVKNAMEMEAESIRKDIEKKQRAIGNLRRKTEERLQKEKKSKRKRESIIESAAKREQKMRGTISELRQKGRVIQSRLQQRKLKGKLDLVVVNPELRTKKGKHEFDQPIMAYPFDRKSIIKEKNLVAFEVNEENLDYLRRKAFDLKARVWPQTRLDNPRVRIIRALVQNVELRKIRRQAKRDGLTDEDVFEIMKWARQQGISISSQKPIKPPTEPKRIRRRNAKKMKKEKEAEILRWKRR